MTEDNERDAIAILRNHVMILERHEGGLEELRREVLELRASIETVILTQREMSQILAGIHAMWARLECVRPRRDPSSELRVVGCESEVPVDGES
jgi:hypothetical protein